MLIITYVEWSAVGTTHTYTNKLLVISICCLCCQLVDSQTDRSLYVRIIHTRVCMCVLLGFVCLCICTQNNHRGKRCLCMLTSYQLDLPPFVHGNQTSSEITKQKRLLCCFLLLFRLYVCVSMRQQRCDALIPLQHRNQTHTQATCLFTVKPACTGTKTKRTIRKRPYTQEF